MRNLSTAFAYKFWIGWDARLAIEWPVPSCAKDDILLSFVHELCEQQKKKKKKMLRETHRRDYTL